MAQVGRCGPRSAVAGNCRRRRFVGQRLDVGNDIRQQLRRSQCTRHAGHLHAEMSPESLRPAARLDNSESVWRMYHGSRPASFGALSMPIALDPAGRGRRSKRVGRRAA